MYISPNPQEKDLYYIQETDENVSTEAVLPWWMEDRHSNRAIHCKNRLNKLVQSQKEDDKELLNIKYLGIINDPEVRKKFFLTLQNAYNN